MLNGFECDEDHTSWLAGAALWASGAVAGFALAFATGGASTVPHWQLLLLACAVSLVSLAIRLPVLLANCAIQPWLLHAVWILPFFAQVNWAGFLAMRAPNATIAAEAIIICWGMEAWLLVTCRNKLTWIGTLLGRSTAVQASALTAEKPSVVRSEVEQHSLVTDKADTADESTDVRRELVDGIDDDGNRYLSGSVRICFEPNQRTDTIVLGFCPVLDSPVHLELECESEEVVAKVEHVTETGARISVRRQSSPEQLREEQLYTTIEWFAQTSDLSATSRSVNLP